MAKLSQAEKVDIVFKKNFGKVSTNTSLAFFSEPSIDARPRIFQSQIFRQTVPTTAPTDFGTINGNGTNYSSSSYSYIKYYYRYQLEQITSGNNQAFKGPSDGDIDNILQNSIPFNYDPVGGYGVVLETSGFETIDAGTGEWVIDPDAGVLTFHEYADVSSIVNSTNKRPYLSFYRYCGTTGIDSSFLFTEASNYIYPNTQSHTLVLGANTLSDQTNVLEVNGNANISGIFIANDIRTLSDKNFKKDIKIIDEPLDKLNKLNGVSFKWKENDMQSYGVIAQDLEKVFPKAVYTSDEGIKTVNYNSIIAVLIESLKKVQSTHFDLKKKYIRLEEQMKLILQNKN